MIQPSPRQSMKLGVTFDSVCSVCISEKRAAMPVLGYGEDALMLHALTRGLATIFHQLNDESDPGKALVFYRPSFGRRSSVLGRESRPEFGEFDAIIGTTQAVYLVEAKWPASGFKLRPEQIRPPFGLRVELRLSRNKAPQRPKA